jgi:DNA-binding transcriptional MocR family regulator
MLLVKLERSSAEPIYRQVARQIIALVEDDALKEGEVLPPTRELAAMLSVSRFTVSQAYRELWAKGYIDSRPGSYTRVRRRPKLASGGARAEAVPVSLRARDAIGSAYSAIGAAIRAKGESVVDFSRLCLDERLFPVDELRSAFNRVLTRKKASLLNYSDAAGYAPLREYIAERMRVHCVSASPEEVLVTNGSLQGIELAAKLFVDRGMSVAVEDPTFGTALPIFGLLGATVDPIPMREDGMDLELLERRFLSSERWGSRPAFAYSIPSFHNPTGITTAQGHRERLLGLCERFGVPLLEDSFQEEITFFGKAVLPIKSMDSSGLVLYLGTFSKVLFPGLRVGWMVGRKGWIERLAALKSLSDMSTSPLVQAALLRFCESGAYDQHLRRINRIFAKRMELAVDALRSELPPERADFARPSGGYLLWLRLRGVGSDEERIAAALAKRGVAASPGRLFFAGPPPGPCLRLSISSLDEDEIAEGARRLGQALRDL